MQPRVHHAGQNRDNELCQTLTLTCSQREDYSEKDVGEEDTDDDDVAVWLAGCESFLQRLDTLPHQDHPPLHQEDTPHH